MRKSLAVALICVLAGCASDGGSVIEKVKYDFGIGEKPEGYVSTSEIIMSRLNAVGQAEMKRMNRQFRGKDYATDVLSFDSMDPTSLGELVLCMPVIRRQARRTGLGERGELGYMIVHGVLHLLGYDHETNTSDEAKMFALQDALYVRLETVVGV